MPKDSLFAAPMFVAFFLLSFSTEACKFQNSGLPNPHGRQLTEVNIEGSPIMAKNAFFNNGGMTAGSHDGRTMIDVMSDLAKEHGEDMCILSLQQLPPPASTVNDAQLHTQAQPDFDHDA